MGASQTVWGELLGDVGGPCNRRRRFGGFYGAALVLR